MTVAEVVRKILDNYPYMKDFLLLDIVNSSALARKIEPEVRKQVKGRVSSEAVVVAIKRYVYNANEKQISKNLVRIIANSDLSLKDDVMCIVVKKSSDAFNKVGSLYSKVDWQRGDVLFVVQGTGTIGIVVNTKMGREVKKLFDDEEIEEVLPNHSIILMQSPPDTSQVPGLTAHTTRLLADHGINLEFFSMGREAAYLVREEDALRAFELLKNCIKEAKKMV